MFSKTIYRSEGLLITWSFAKETVMRLDAAIIDGDVRVTAQ